MNMLGLNRVPERLVRSLHGAEPSRRPGLAAGDRAEAVSWLRRTIVDFDAMEGHLALLSDLYAEPISLGGPGRPSEGLTHPFEPGPASRFRLMEPLADDRVVAVADIGVEALSNDELARLLLNPGAMIDLARVINELSPEPWQDAWQEAGREWFEVNEGRPLVAPAAPEAPLRVVEKPRVRSWIRWSPAIAASLLLGVTLLSRVRGPDEDAGRSWSARANLVSRGTRGSGESVRVEITSEFDGFATIIGLFPDGRPSMVPGPAGDPIHIKPGPAVESPPMPDDWGTPVALLVVITPSPSDDIIRKALFRRPEPKFTPEQAGELADFLRARLRDVNHSRVAIATVSAGAATPSR